MSDSPINVDRLQDLTEAICDQSASGDDLGELDVLLLADQASRRWYLDCCQMRAALRFELRASRAAQRACKQINAESVVSAPIESDIAAGATPPIVPGAYPTFTLLGSAIHGTAGYFSSGWPVAYLVATVVFGIGLLIGTFVHVSHSVQVARQPVPLPSPLTPLPSMVGRITGMVDCQWADPQTAPFGYDAVPLGRRYALASGLVEITYNSGARVILQGPVTYEVESAAGGYLSLGKLTARLEKGSGVRGQGSEETHLKSEIRNLKSEISGPRPLTPGPFAIRTPTATVTDLGTEFGVEVSKEGHTTSHVFRGSVRLQAASADGKTEGIAQVLHENQSARVDARSADHITVLDSSAKPVGFVRAIPKRIIKTLDLVDVVAGGDGFSGRRNRGIDPTTGRTAIVQPTPLKLTGDHRYHRVDSLPFVDGVFMPDGGHGPVQLDSAGHTYDFSKTDNLGWGYIWVGGSIATPSETIPTALAGIDYGSPGHGVLFMHANKGITFDLEAIRRANPGRKLLRFRATAGNTETISERGDVVHADLWVFVDGQVRVQRRQINSFNGAIPIGIALGDQDRFLTIAVTDGGNGLGYDWVIFGDPVLELVEKVVPDQATEGTEEK